MASYRLSVAACDALSAASLSWGGGGLEGMTDVDDDGYVSLVISEEVLAKLLQIDSSLDTSNPVELSDMIIDLVHGNMQGWGDGR